MTSRRKIAATALLLTGAVVVGGLALAGGSSARQTSAQKAFRKILLADSEVDPAIKALLRENGFVERRAVFADFTGEGRTDAIVFVNSGAISGTVASYVLSSESGREMHVVHVDESGQQVSARVERGDRGAAPSLVLEDPSYAAGDPPCCASTLVRRTYRWDRREHEFDLVSRRRVRSRIDVSR
jgi:hypothetical protein